MKFLVGLIVLMVPFLAIAQDKVIVNGKVWTGNDEQPWAEAIAIQDNRIVAVGSSNDISSKYMSAEKIDVGGKLVLPGFIDNHVHFMDGSSSLVNVQTFSAKTPDDFSNIIADYAKTMEKGAWMLGGIWDHMNWGGELPRKEWIDEATKDNPLFLGRTDGHTAFANSAALKFAGISKDTPDPAGGVIVRDDNGEPTGVLIDNAMYMVSKIYPTPTDEAIDAAFDAGIDEALRNGVTEVHSIDMTIWDNLSIFKKAKAENRLKIRTYYVSHISKRHELAEMIASEGKGDDFLRFGAVKIMSDGALGSGTAWFYDDFSDEPGNSGFPLLPMADVKVQAQEAHDYGFQLAIHAIGDKANDEILSIIDQIGAKDNRARIEHAQHVKTSTLGRFKELGVIAAVHPYHVYDDGRFAEKRIGKDRVKEIYTFNSFLESGAKVTFGSDWSVAPLKPLLGIYAATTRHTGDGNNPDGWNPDEKITVEQAVRAYTIDGAYGGHNENNTGSIEVGKLADIVVLSDNIFEIDPSEIINTRVEMTIIDGEVLYKAE